MSTFNIKTVDGGGSLAVAQSLVAEIQALTPKTQRVAQSAIAAALREVIPVVCRDIHPLPSGSNGRSEVAADGTVTSAHFEIFRKGKADNYYSGWVGNLCFERQPGGTYSIRFHETDRNYMGSDEMFPVGPTVTARSLSAKDLRAPLTKLFAHGSGVRESVQDERSLREYYE